MTNFLSHQMILNIIQSGIALIILSLSYLPIYYLFINRLKKREKQREKIKVRIFYGLIIFYVLILAKIWIENFTHIVTMLSIVAAGIVVTNKESIMNLVGYLIINWRGLFVEGDIIQIQSYSGYVDSVGPMYIKLYETSQIDRKQATGKTIKIPNGLVITNAVFNLSLDTNFCLYHIEVPHHKDATLQELNHQLLSTIQTLLHEHYEKDPKFNLKTLQHENPHLATLLDLKPAVLIKLVPDKQEEAKIRVSFYCYPSDFPHIERKFWDKYLALM